LMAPSAGEIIFDGMSIESLGSRTLARRVQPVFQDPYSSLNPRKTVGAIIRVPLAVHHVGDPSSRRGEVERMMALVGLPPHLYGAYPGQLSGGQRQRVAIARALILRPEVVICDEPTSALDVSVQSQILNLLQDLQEEFGLTYVLISHNLAVVEHIATRVAVMYLGRIVEENDTETLFRAPRHPYTRALLLSVLTPEPGLGVPDTHLGSRTRSIHRAAARSIHDARTRWRNVPQRRRTLLPSITDSSNATCIQVRTQRHTQRRMIPCVLPAEEWRLPSIGIRRLRVSP
jgi:peptide/nickel transport system ATP-binding protein